MARVELLWSDQSRQVLDTFQVDDLAAEDAGWPGPAEVRDEPGPDGETRTRPYTADGRTFTPTMMMRHLRAAAKAALLRAGDPRAEQFDTLCLSVMPAGDGPDPTDPAQPDG